MQERTQLICYGHDFKSNDRTILQDEFFQFLLGNINFLWEFLLHEDVNEEIIQWLIESFGHKMLDFVIIEILLQGKSPG